MKKNEIYLVNKTIILCGSMKIKNKIFEVKEILEKKVLIFFYQKNV